MNGIDWVQEFDSGNLPIGLIISATRLVGVHNHTSLPDHLTVNGDFAMRYYKSRRFPVGLTINGNFCIDLSQIRCPIIGLTVMGDASMQCITGLALVGSGINGVLDICGSSYVTLKNTSYIRSIGGDSSLIDIP